MLDTSQPITPQQEAYQGEPEAVEALAAAANSLVPYEAKSGNPFTLETVIPKNLAFEVQSSLNGVVRSRGNVDTFVQQRLRYRTKKDLHKALAAEQVDSMGLYLHQFDKGMGLIVGDQTGVGKGRQAAAVIRHAILNGYTPVFFTRKPDLFTDMYRDLKGIDFADINPFILNTSSDARVKDKDGAVVFSPLSRQEQEEMLIVEKRVPSDSPEALAYYRRLERRAPTVSEQPFTELSGTVDHLPDGYDCIFVTYSQVQQAAPYKRDWLENLANKGIEGDHKQRKLVFVLDESHMAGGFDSQIGIWMRRVLPLGKAAMFLSATFAKYPEVMPFYAKKTAIAEAKLGDEDLVQAMRTGGLPMTEIVAANLAESGQLIRRQRSREGIKREYIVLDEEPLRSQNLERVDRVVTLINEIVDFEAEYVMPVLAALHKEAMAEGAQLKDKPRALGVKQTPYFSRVFNIVDQMLFALMVEAVAEKTLALLREDKKVVIAFKSTMGAFLKDLNYTSGDRMAVEEMDFAKTLKKGLDSVLYYHYTNIAGEKTRRMIPLGLLGYEGETAFNDLKERLDKEVTELSVSPIDDLIHLIESARKEKSLGGHNGQQFKVTEVTGRTQRLVREDQEYVVRGYRADTEKSYRMFNNGSYDVLLINQSGSTGSSAHASRDFEDTRQRAMVIHQFEVDVATEVQKWGRIDRTGQIHPPEYYYMIADVPSMRRMLNMLKSKLKLMDAITTGSQKTNDTSLKSEDFFNKYGDQAAFGWVTDNDPLARQMGNPTYTRKIDKYGEVKWERHASKENAMRQVTGRVALLPVATQSQVYDQLLERYQNIVRMEQQQGTYDLEAEFLKLDADLKATYEFKRGAGGQSPFGKNTYREESIVNNLKRPYRMEEVQAMVTRYLGGKTPEEKQQAYLDRIAEDYPALIEKRRLERQATIDKYEDKLREIPDPSQGVDAAERARFEVDTNKLRETIREKQQALNATIAKLKGIRDTMIRNLSRFQAGDVVVVPVLGTTDKSYGVFVGVDLNMGEDNPYVLSNLIFRFVVADSRRIVEYNLAADMLPHVVQIADETQHVAVENREEARRDWDQLIQKSSQRREKRQMLTGNLLQVLGHIGMHNKLIKFNTKTNTIKNGVLLQRGFGESEEDNKTLLPISEALPYLEGLDMEKVFMDQKGVLLLRKLSDTTYKVSVKKQAAYDLNKDVPLRSLLLKPQEDTTGTIPEFIQQAGDMIGAVHQRNLENFLTLLNKYGFYFLGEARALEPWELEDAAVVAEPETPGILYRYALGQPYASSSQPTTGFVQYTDPDDAAEHGYVEFSRRLSDKERFSFSLVPVFTSPSAPYEAWKAHFDGSPVWEEFQALLKEVAEQPIHQAVPALGRFVLTHQHEDGNPEFVFGQYSAWDLGEVAYPDQIGAWDPLRLSIEQLQALLSRAA